MPEHQERDGPEVRRLAEAGCENCGVRMPKFDGANVRKTFERFLAVASVAAIVAAGCSDGSSMGRDASADSRTSDGGITPMPDGGGGGSDTGGPAPDMGRADSNPDGGMPPDGGPMALEFSAFVKDLIQNKTSATGVPETVDDKMFVDSMDPTAFDVLFP